MADKKRNKKKVLLIGWDAADWKMINPMLDRGEMPTLNKMIENGVMGNLLTLDPPFSPTLWTSISTGKRPYKHGIYGFTEPDPSGTSIRPVHITSRKCKAIWNILSHKGYKTSQVGWWPSHPAEPINGVSVSNFYQRANKKIFQEWEMMPGTVHPEDKSDIFKALRVHPQELTGAHIHPFLRNHHKISQRDKGDQRRLTAISKIIADCSTIQAAATYILDNEEWDFAAVYFDAIDHMCHGFMKFHPPRRPFIPEDLYDKYHYCVTAIYKYHDMMLEAMLDMVPKDTTVILVSDHGFHSNHLRPSNVPKEPAGLAWEHSPYGIFVATGPGIKKDEIIHGASLLDVTPTILNIYGLPVGKDMDGKVLNHIFEKPRKVKAIPTWEDVEGDFYMHTSEYEEDEESARESLQQLIDLGYIAPLSTDNKQNVERVINDNKFFKARTYIDAGKYSEAIEILEELYENAPGKKHVILRLAHCYLVTKRTAKARNMVQAFRQVHTDINNTLLILQSRVVAQEGDLEKGKQYIEEAIERKSDHPGIHFHHGDVLLKLEQYNEAIQAFEKAIDHDPENQNAHHSIGKAYYHMQEYEKSVDSHLTAIGLHFFAPQVHYDLGQALEKLELYSDAANAYNNCRHMMPKHIKAKKRLYYLFDEVLNRPKLAAEVQATLPDYHLPEIVVVSGLPRSGTSMMMQMLEAGGMTTFTDGIRIADENNKKGYYEHEAVKHIARDHSFLEKIGDSAVKIVAPLLFHLPKNYRYKIIFMERELGEILLSQHKMLKRNKRRAQKETFSFKLWKDYENTLNKIKKTYKSQKNASLLFVDYREIIESPGLVIPEIKQFLDNDNLDANKMMQVVDKSLYRERENVATE